LHTDAAQAVGKMETLVDDLGVDLLSIAGHKFYAPKGVVALYVRRGTSIEPLVHGAGHEGGRRAGTESVLLAAALGKASEMAKAPVDLLVTASLCALLWDKLRGVLGNRVALNGRPTRRLPNTLNVSFIDEIGADLLARIPSVAASTGSACHTGDLKLSPVLEAMGVAPEAGIGAIRFSLGRWTTLAEIDETVALLRRAIS
jgi:cysteine desulfurase